MSLMYFYDTTTCKCNTENTSTISRAIYIVQIEENNQNKQQNLQTDTIYLHSIM
jgi:hypothetical protein